MACKVTLYVRDEDLWRRAREAGGLNGLSALVEQCLRARLDRADVAAVSLPTVLERARRLRQEAEALVRHLEDHGSNTHQDRQQQRAPRSPSPRSLRKM